MKFKNFEIRETTDIHGTIEADRYDIVKWDNDKYCLTIGWLEYDAKEPCWEFRGCGLRYQEYYEEGLNEFILKYAEVLSVCKQYHDDEMEKFLANY